MKSKRFTEHPLFLPKKKKVHKISKTKKKNSLPKNVRNATVSFYHRYISLLLQIFTFSCNLVSLSTISQKYRPKNKTFKDKLEFQKLAHKSWEVTKNTLSSLKYKKHITSLHRNERKSYLRKLIIILNFAFRRFNSFADFTSSCNLVSLSTPS